MTDYAAQPEWITKIDVAERQLCEAVRYFFERRDPIIVHALVSAGLQVLTDLGNASGVIGLVTRQKRVKFCKCECSERVDVRGMIVSCARWVFTIRLFID
jgi:hypothetical protein